jgi:hypothetical protein
VADRDAVELARILGAMTRVVQDPGAPELVTRDARGFLREAMGEGADADATAAMGGARLLLYRRLVRRGLLSAIRAQLPCTAARFGPSLDAYVGRWIDEEMPRSHYLRDIAGELVAWAAPRWMEDASLPRWAADLARHEITLFEVGSTPGGGEPQRPLALGARARFEKTARLARYAFAVHRMTEADAAPEETPTALFLYRDAEHEVRCLSLSLLAAAILERLLEGHTLGEAVRSGCEALGQPLDQAVLEGTAALLADLAERGALLGAEAEEHGP